MQSCFHTYENVTWQRPSHWDLEIWSGDMGYARAGRKKQRGKGVCFHNTSSFYQSSMLRECSTNRSSRGEDIEVSYRHRRYWTTCVSLVWNCFHTHENVDDGMKLRLFGMKCWRYETTDEVWNCSHTYNFLVWNTQWWWYETTSIMVWNCKFLLWTLLDFLKCVNFIPYGMKM